VSAPSRFLQSLAQSLSTMMLYPREHPTWAKAVDASYSQLEMLVEEHPNPSFSFIGSDVIHGSTPLHDLRDWPWSQKLAEVGVQRLEFGDDVSRQDYETFLAEVLSRMVQAGVTSAPPTVPVNSRIRYGQVTVDEVKDGALLTIDRLKERTPVRGIAFGLSEEAAAMAWIQEQSGKSDVLPLVEADAVVRSLTVAMRGSSSMIIPLLRLKASDPYNAIHSINVSVLTMALAEAVGVGSRDVHEFGMAALLHDLGMARVPKELMAKPTELTDEERLIIERHPLDGARIILSSDKRLDIAAAVAYEHHLRPDGSGYPVRAGKRQPHFASRLVRICSVYNALRIPRAHRTSYSAEQAISFIVERAGREFDAELTRAFADMMRRLEPRITEVERDHAVHTPALGTTVIPDSELHH